MTTMPRGLRISGRAPALIIIAISLASSCSPEPVTVTPPLAGTDPTVSPSEGLFTPPVEVGPKTETPSSPNRSGPGRIYAWLYGATGYAQYGFINPIPSELASLSDLSPIDQNVPGPTAAVALAFSRTTDKVAYVTIADTLEVWVSDLPLHNVNLAWTDEGNLFSSLSPHPGDLFSMLELHWDANDQVVILTATGAYPPLLILNPTTFEAHVGQGECNRLSQAAGGQSWEIWCLVETSTGSSSVVLRDSGALSTGEAPPSAAINVVDWVFSPAGGEIAFVADDLQLRIGRIDGSVVDLPVVYAPANMGYPKRRGIQWDKVGEHILAYGFPQIASLCPRGVDLVSGEPLQRPCWLLVSATSREVVWWPTESIAQSVGRTWENLHSTSDGTISPDGKWVFLSLLGPPFRFAVVTSSSGATTFQVHAWDIDLVTWASH